MTQSPQPSELPYVHALVQGYESELKIDLLLGITNLQSDDVIAALKNHFIKGMPQKMIPEYHGISQQQFSRGKKRLNEVYQVVQQLNDVK